MNVKAYKTNKVFDGTYIWFLFTACVTYTGTF